MLHVDIVDKNLKLWPSQQDVEYIERMLKGEWLAGSQALIGFNIAASNKWQSKRWPLKNFAKLADEVTKRFNARVVITGTNQDSEVGRKFAKMTKSKPVVFIGKTTPLQLAALIEKCKVYITSDSAPMHVAASVRTPFVALFGPTDPKRHVPRTDRYTVIYMSEKCSPCYKSDCKNNICMHRISVDEVMKHVAKWMEVE